MIRAGPAARALNQLDELEAAATKAKGEAQQRSDRLQQKLDEALRAKDEADAKARGSHNMCTLQRFQFQLLLFRLFGEEPTYK